MAMRVETNPLEAAYAALLENGLDGAGEALRILVNEAAKLERSAFLGARPYERTETRRDYANGFKPKTVLTRHGELTFQVPQVRSGDFYPSALEKGTRTDQAVNLALAEMYVQGVSTRRVIDVLQRLLGPEISLSSAQVSRAAAKLDEGLRAWRERPLGETPYLFLDARYEKVRMEGRIVDCAVLIAVGIEASGKRRVLGCEVATSEAEISRLLPGSERAGVLLQMELAALPGHGGEYGPAGRLESGMIVGDDELDAREAAGEQLLQETVPVDLRPPDRARKPAHGPGLAKSGDAHAASAL